MRRLFFLLVLASLAACDITQVDDADAGDAGDAAVSECDKKNDCSVCQTCAAQKACLKWEQACNQSSECIGLDQCIKLCGADAACRQGCSTSNPGGIQLYGALVNCLSCEQCPSDCAGYYECGS